MVEIENAGAGSSVRIEHHPPKNPGNSDLNINLTEYREFLLSKFSRSYALQLFNNGIKHFDCLESPQGISAIPAGVRGNVLKAIVNLAKYLGKYDEYKSKLSNCGIKWERSNGLRAFLRIFNASNNDIIKWYKEAREKLEYFKIEIP